MEVRVPRRLQWLVVIVLALVLRPAPAQAWNPWSAVKSAVGKVASAAADLIGVGSFIDTATKPAIHNLEDTGQTLIKDASTAIGTQITAAQTTGTALLTQGKGIVDDANLSLEARIVQVNLAGDELIDRAVGRLDAVALQLIANIKVAATQLIANVNDALEQRLAQVHQIATAAIQQADQAAAARIAQLDEVAGRRLGNLDVIATKQSLGIEVILLRIALLIGCIAFTAFVLWRLFVEAGAAWRHPDVVTKTGLTRIAGTARHGLPWFLLQVVLAFCGGLFLWWVSNKVVHDAQDRVDQQLAEHTAALATAEAAYDFTNVRYETSQLQILDPAHDSTWQAAERKAEVLRDVLTRPALLQDIAGVRQVAAQLTLVEAAATAANKPPDPDILALEGFVQWQVAGTRRDEYEAAKLCAASLAAAGPGKPLLLAVLARNYLRVFFHDPYTPDADVTAADLDTLRAAVPTTVDTDNPQFQHLVDYDTFVAQLDTASTNAYLDMLDAQVDVELAQSKSSSAGGDKAKLRDARDRRTKAADAVIAAWSAFDTSLQSSLWLANDPTSLAAFTLNDVVLAHAKYFHYVTGAEHVLPELVNPPKPAKGVVVPSIAAAVRVQIAPIRVAWARRYATLIGDNAQSVVAVEETQRYVDFEKNTVAFEAAYIAFETAAKSASATPDPKLGDLAAAAVETASALELYRGTDAARRPLAAALLDDLAAAHGPALSAAQLTAISVAYQRRPLDFL